MWLDNKPLIAQAYQLKANFYALYDLPKAEDIPIVLSRMSGSERCPVITN